MQFCVSRILVEDVSHITVYSTFLNSGSEYRYVTVYSDPEFNNVLDFVIMHMDAHKFCPLLDTGNNYSMLCVHL